MTFYWGLFLLADATICVYAWVRWNKLRRENSELRLNFRLIELWAMTFAFSPALALFALTLRLDQGGGESAFLVLVLLIPHQVVVAFLTVLRNHTDPVAMKEAKDLNTFQQFVFMLNSTLVGLLIPIVTVCAAMVILFTLGVTVLFGPIVVPVLIFVAVYYYSKKRAAPLATRIARPEPLSSAPPKVPAPNAEGESPQ